MTKAAKTLRYSLLLLIIIFASGCAPARKNTYYQKKKSSSSHVSSERIGRNKYFFSPEYQKKLNKSYKKKR